MERLIFRILRYFNKLIHLNVFFLLVNSWCKSRRLKHLGVPMFLGSGSFDHNSTKLRFLVMERYGKDVEELFLGSGRRFDVSTVLMLGLRVVSI